jgi:hypothetical protein
MSLDPTALFLSLVLGGVGFVLVVYGKKQDRWPQLVAGLLYMIYPYFVSSVVAMVALGVAIGTGLWMALRFGW